MAIISFLLPALLRQDWPCSSVAKSCLTPCLSELQHPRLSCPSLSPKVCSNACPWRQWCHPTISSSVTLCSFALQSFLTSWPFAVSQLFATGGQSIGPSASESVLPMTVQGWFLLGLTGLISSLSKGLSRVFSIAIWKHHFFFFFWFSAFFKV